MIADVMHCFPTFSYDYIMDSMTFKQFILWHCQSMRILHEVDFEIKDSDDNLKSELDKINEKLKWNEETKRFE